MRRQLNKVRLGAIASRQHGRITWAQIRALGADRAAVTTWIKQGYLHRRLPGVYAVGHTSGSTEADLAAALLYAGPGAMLSHATAAWWWRLLDDPPRLIHVSTPRQCCSQPGVRVHARRTHERVWHRGFPTTTLPQTLLDLAAHEPLRTVRRALAKADYSRLLEIAAVEAILGRGRRGSRTLAAALAEHQPRFARTRSQNEILFLEICEAAGIPLPEVNVRVAGWEVDALWRAERIAVEIDGYGNHRSRAQVRRDRQKDLALRSHGYTPLRYSDEQIYDHRDEVIADLRRASGA